MKFNLYKRAKQLEINRNIKDVLFISMGVLFASIGLRGFLLPNDFLDGGAMGVSLLLDILTGIELSYLIILVNLPFIILGARQISLSFAVKSIVAILCLAILVHFETFPIITNDKLLIAVFGGFFLGAGIGLTIRGGAVIDGTEVLAISVSRKSSLTVGDFIAVFNIVLFALAAFLVGIEKAMYSMLTYLAASKTVDFIINGIEEYIGVFIVSRKADEVYSHVSNNLRMGISTFNSSEFNEEHKQFVEADKILYCVVTRLEVAKLLLEVEKIDEKAFVVQHGVKDTKGGMIKKRPLH